MTPPLLEVRQVRKTFAAPGLWSAKRNAVVKDVSFTVAAGEAVALVGASGSGKSTLARLILRLERADAGQILLDGVDVLAAERRRASRAYRSKVQMVFQDPFASLNPVHTVAHHLTRPLLRHRRASPSEARGRAGALLQRVGLEPPDDFLDKLPFELSGGQRQRVAIARALAVEPRLLIADEPTSMLDVSIRVGVLNLLASLKQERRLGILLITHDLASARYLADRVVVLHQGEVVEEGPPSRVLASPKHPYTRTLLEAAAGSSEVP